MRPKLVIVLLLLVLVPLGLMAWLGAGLVKSERAEVQQAFQQLHTEKLTDVEAAIQKVVQGRERVLSDLAGKLSLTPAALRELVRNQPSVRQVFALDIQGKLIHPPITGPRSQAETEFLERAKPVWADSSIFFGPGGEQKPPPGHGWYTWYWESGINLVFWHRNPNGIVIGFELDRFRLLADIIAELPDDSTFNTPDTRLALLDSRDAVLYQWGDYQPGPSVAAVATLGVGAPLKPWKLTYHTSRLPAGASGSGTLFLLLAGLAAVGLALVGLAFYFYRESSREIREAGQRVSFVNHVSHELKTPLTNIRMYAELLQERLDNTDEKPARYLDVVVTESQRLSRLIDNVLTFSRHQRGSLKLRMLPRVVDETIARLVEYFAPALEDKDTLVEFVPGAPGRVMVDTDALEQILSNLLGNVEKYAAGGSVKVSTTCNGNTTTILVADSGPGIPDSDRKRVFEPFVRLGAGVDEGAAGTGIGLSIARELARLHGGDLTLKPSRQGAVFELTLSTPAEN